MSKQETEMKKVYVYVRSYREEIEICVSSSQFDSTYCSDITSTASAPLCEMEILVPTINNKDAIKVLSGALLETLIKEKEKLKADTHIAMERLNKRINDLQCIDYKKADDNE